MMDAHRWHPSEGTRLLAGWAANGLKLSSLTLHFIVGLILFWVGGIRWILMRKVITTCLHTVQWMTDWCFSKRVKDFTL
ncbi:MAG: hypothetical protein WAT46_06420 [Saprospiraceae bacterium]